MPPKPDMDTSIQTGIDVDQSMTVETGGKRRSEQADPVIDKTPKKKPWYKRRKILYSIAIAVALISVGLAVFAILWASGTIDTSSSGATASSTGSDGNAQDNSSSNGETPATEPPTDNGGDSSPPPPPPPDASPTEQASDTTPVATALPTATPTAPVQTTQPPRTDPLSFYVMGDVPYADWEAVMLGTQMGEMHSSLAPGSAFVVHVGDMQKATRTQCALEHFYKIANILLTGPLPTFVQVGDNDYLDCPEPEVAYKNYLDTFVGMEGNWSHPLQVERWTTPVPAPVEFDVTRVAANPEMFAFLEDGVLFMGYTLLNMNLDQGEVPDDLFYQRLADSKAWVTKQLNDKKQQGIRAVVMFSHAMVSPDIRPFFEDLQEIFTGAGVYAPVLYIHGDGHDWKINTELGLKLGWPQFTRVEVDQGAYADPLLITVAPDLGGISQTLVADNSGSQFVVGNGMFLIDRQGGRYPESVNPNY